MSERIIILVHAPGKVLEYFRKTYDLLVVLRRTISLLCFFVISLAALDAEPGRISFSFQTAPEIAVKKDYRYTAKSQIGIYGETYLNVDIASSFFAQAGLGYGRYGPSGAGSDWVIYRGFTVFYYGAGAGMYLPDFTLFGFIPFDPGFALRGFFDYGSYLYTDIYYFYPAVELELFTTVGRFWDDYFRLRVGLPMSWNFQRDLEVFFAAGISLHGVLYLPKLSSN